MGPTVGKIVHWIDDAIDHNPVGVSHLILAKTANKNLNSDGAKEFPSRTRGPHPQSLDYQQEPLKAKHLK